MTLFCYKRTIWQTKETPKKVPQQCPADLEIQQRVQIELMVLAMVAISA